MMAIAEAAEGVWVEMLERKFPSLSHGRLLNVRRPSEEGPSEPWFDADQFLNPTPGRRSRRNRRGKVRGLVLFDLAIDNKWRG